MSCRDNFQNNALSVIQINIVRVPSSHTCNFKYIYNEREKKEKTRGKKKKNKKTDMPIGQIQIFLQLH